MEWEVVALNWVLFGTTLICGLGWLRAELAGRAACELLTQNGIRPTEAEINAASNAVIKRILSRRKA